MATITEDYVSFETAKLLKEKGFDVYGDGSFGSEIKIWMEYSPFGKIRDISPSRPSIKGYPAPTHQMAVKWLLKKYNIFICILFLEEFDEYGYTIENVAEKKYLATSKNSSYKKPENACDIAIKYCLENLI